MLSYTGQLLVWHIISHLLIIIYGLALHSYLTINRQIQLATLQLKRLAVCDLR